MAIPLEKCERKTNYSCSPPACATPIKIVKTQKFLRKGGNNEGTLDILFGSIVELYALKALPLDDGVSNGNTIELSSDAAKLYIVANSSLSCFGNYNVPGFTEELNKDYLLFWN